MKLLLAVTALMAVASANRVPFSDPRCPPRDAAFPVYFRHSADCAVFYQCSNGAAYKFDCPAGTLFDTTLNVCNWPDAVICDEGSGDGSGDNSGDGSGDEDDIAPVDPVEPVEPVEPVDPVKPDDDASLAARCADVPSNVYKQFAHRADCTKYYTCSHQRAVLQVCPPNLHYNADEQVCDFPERAGCEELLEYRKA